MEISLYGGTGFIGSAFRDRQPLFQPALNTAHVIPRSVRRPVDNTDMLYMISTTHNYNVFSDPTLDVVTNLEVLTEVLECWRHQNPTGVFNFISSWFVYGNEYPSCGYAEYIRAWDDLCGKNYVTWNGGAREDDECHPKGFYSITKRCAEQLIESYAETFDLKYRILRLANVLGNSDQGVSKQKNAFQYLISEMRAGRDIDLYNGGDFYRNYIHVHDVCDAIHLVMTKGDLNTIYNVGAHNVKFIDMMNYAALQIGYNVTGFNHVSASEFHKTVQAKSFTMETRKLQNLGFVPQYTPETMIDSLL